MKFCIEVTLFDLNREVRKYLMLIQFLHALRQQTVTQTQLQPTSPDLIPHNLQGLELAPQTEMRKTWFQGM